MSDELQELYKHSDTSVRAHGIDAAAAGRIYADYARFVTQAAAPTGDLLDVGCGSGWSSYEFSMRSYRTTGMDLNAAFFEPSPNPHLQLRAGSVMALPFAEESFDVVTAYQMLEHVPDPAGALTEMLRVLRPQGVLCVVGPNLISPLYALRALALYSWRNRPLRRVFVRDARMPRHPCGNTAPETLLSVFHNLARIGLRICSSRPRFEMRVPDLVPPFQADNDACYLCNPLDLVRFFAAKHCQVLRNGKPGRPPFSNLLASGTWIAIRKPSALPAS